MWKYCQICCVSITIYIYIYIYIKGKKIQTEDFKKKKCWCLWAGSLVEAGWEGLLLVKVGVKRKVGVDMDWRVDTWDSKRCACEWPKISRQWNFIQCLSLSLSFGDPIATSCVLFFFFWLDALCVPMGEGRKTFYKIGICFIYFILFYIISSKSKQSFSLNCLKDCPCRQQVIIGSTVKGVTLWNFIWNFVLWWY